MKNTQSTISYRKTHSQYYQTVKKLTHHRQQYHTVETHSQHTQQYQTIKNSQSIRAITKFPNSEQSYKGKVKTHKYINRQNQSTTQTTISYNKNTQSTQTTISYRIILLKTAHSTQIII